MLAIFLQTLPFFLLIGLGYVAAWRGFFPPEATAYLTRFVFFFALSAMLFRFAANLSLAAIFRWDVVLAYLCATAFVYLLASLAAWQRGVPGALAAIEAQCAVIGNVGFLGIPMLALLLGPVAIGPILLVLSVDLIVFGSLVVIVITVARDGQVSARMLRSVLLGLLRNPMIVAIALGLIVAALGWRVPAPVDDFLAILAGAATPGALFAIGASLAASSAERLAVAGWLSFCKLVLHPLAVAFAALLLFDVDGATAAVIIAAAALPVAGNVYMVAQHYGVAPARASAAIFVSTVISLASLPVVIALVAPLG